jgi:hypothetical protein
MAMEINDIVGGRGGFGFGGGGDGMGVLLGLLLARNGFGNDRDRDDCGKDYVTQSDLNGMALGDIKAAIPLSEAQIQLALAGNQAALTQLIASVGNQLQNGQTALLLQGCNQTNTLQTSIAAVDTNVDRQACDIRSAIHADGEATRALITSNQIAELNQKLTVAQLDGLELRQRNDRDRERHSVEITMTQNQQQAQLQAQQQGFLLNQLAAQFGQFARATNGNVIVGNAGATTTGAQTASPTNVNA